ncbi:MAG: hypothetical protein Salg2KO_10690 [Salibacteraceae bacterium]
MKKQLLYYLLSVVSLAGFGQATFNIPFDTVIQTCPPDSVHLYMYTDSGNSNGYIADTIPYNTEPVGGTNVPMFDDQVLGPFNIGFDFSFYCGQYTQFYLCSNGWIGFSAGQTQTWVVQAIPNVPANTPKNTIMGPWRDWRPVTNQNYISYQTVGTAPLRKLIVTWNAVPMFSCTQNLGTFQIVLHEGSNIIHNNLTNVPVCINWGNGDGTNGVHNNTGTIATAVTGRNDSQFTVTNQSIRFIPTSPISWSTTSGGPPFNIGNGVYATFNQSTWVYASGVTCNNDTVKDSAYVAVSCIDLLMDSIDIDCTGDSTGIAVAIDTSSVTSGPYTFYWIHDGSGDTLAIHNSTDSIDTLFNAPAGDYTVFAFAANGEFALDFTSINEPDTVVGLMSSDIDVLCFGDTTGQAVAIDTNDYTGLNWDGIYNYYWSLGNTPLDTTLGSTNNSDTLKNVGAGTYNVTIDGCLIQTGSATVDEPTLMAATISNPTSVSCPGGLVCDASALGNGAGGVPPYTYQWSSGEISQQAIALCPDTNWLTVTDANGCDSTTFIIISVPDTIRTNAFEDTLICITNFAALTAASTGGTPPFSYIWTQDTLEGDTIALNASTSVSPEVTTEYYVTSTDANGCPGDSAKVKISVRPELGLIIPDLDTICPYDTIDITMQGTGGDSLYSYAWSNGEFGETISVSPDLSQWYTVTVGDLCGTPEYIDSVFVQVGGYPKINANIEIEDDSICAGKSLYLIASGLGGWRGPDEYNFEWNQIGWSGNPIQFDQPLTTTQYIITITDLCLSPAGSDTVTIHVGTPEPPTIDATPTIACSYADVALYALDPWQPGYDYNWSFGDGDARFNAQSDTVFHQYSEPGCYDVSLEVTTDFGCSASRIETCLIRILESPDAAFTYSPIRPTTLEPIVTFQDESLEAERIQWLIDDSDWTTDSVFHYEFKDTGWYEVQLIATSEDGCLDTVFANIHHAEGQTIYIPQSFSPNGDGLNDDFRIVGEAISPQGFEFVVLDRWGHKIFYTKNPEFGWDGRRIADGEYVNAGTYAYMLRYVDSSGEPRKRSGSIVVGKTGNPTGLK